MRKCGYLLDEERPVRPMLTGVPRKHELPSRWRCFTPEPMDQGDTNACTGFAAKAMIDGTAEGMGKPFRSSALGLYTIARYHGSMEGPLEDRGAHFRGLFEMAMDFGVVSDQDRPWSAEEINRGLDFEALIKAQDRLLRPHGWYSLDDKGDMRMNAIRSAIYQGYPVGGAWAVAAGFQEEATGAFGRVHGMWVYRHELDTSNFVGNHAMVICGYDEVEGEEYFLIQNSWGYGFGDNGLFWAHRDWIETAWDLTVVKLAP